MLFEDEPAPAGKPFYSADSRKKHQPPMPGTAWERMERELDGRAALFIHSHNHLYDFVDDPETRFRLAAADAFVEKAQYRLTGRSWLLATAGTIASLGTMSLLLLTAHWLHFETISVPANGFALTIQILRSLTVGGLVGGAAYGLFALAKAFFHEATVLVTRRHSLRFGRLCLYLSHGRLDPETLMKVFRWSEEVGSAFLDLKAEELKGGPGKIAEQIAPILDSLAKLGNATAAKAKP